MTRRHRFHSYGDVVVAVPVRNEAERLPRLLASLAQQHSAPSFRLALFFDSCTDSSFELVAALAGDLPYKVVTARTADVGLPNAGRARRSAVALAMSHEMEGILLTTDADSQPAPDWIAANLAALETADVVAGRITQGPGPSSEKRDRLECYFDRLHAIRRAIDPVDWEASRAHHWTSSASLALRMTTYSALGGFEPIPNGEDAALCDAAARAGYRVRRDARVTVQTSTRRLGRADQGFAAMLRMLDDADELPTVSHPDDEAWRFLMHAAARTRHGAADYGHLAERLGLPHAEVDQVATECRNGEAFAARIVGAPPQGMRTVCLGEAERLLAKLENGMLERVA
ncbi:MAG: glycosyltransferase [Methylobacterium mesophilicum]|nr:glycosyltransferase [Methylobacterium mesophilicum]